MNPMTAVGVILICLAVLGLRGPSRSLQRLGWLGVVLCAVLACLKIAWFLRVISWPVDRLLFTDLLLMPSHAAIQMAPGSCVNFLLQCLALWSSGSFFRQRFPHLTFVPVLCLGIEGFIGLMAFLNLVYYIQGSTQLDKTFPMSLPTSVSFICLALSQLLTDKNMGFESILWSNDTTGITTRRMVVGAVLVPIVIGGLTQRAVALGLFSSALSISISCALLVVCFLSLVLWTSGALSRYESQKTEHEHEMQLMMDAHFEGVTITIGGIVLHANTQFYRMTGYEPEEVIGRPITNFVASQSKFQVTNRIKNQNQDAYRAWGRHKNGSEFEIEIIPNAVAWHGQLARISVVRDITQQRSVEKLKDEFVSVVSHELRTPVTSIQGSLGLLAGKVAGELPPAAQTLVDVALRNSQRLTLLINDILDIQKIESGTITFNLQELNLSDLIRAAIEANSAYATGLKIRLVFNDAAPQLRITSDPDRLTQVITNLLSNAAKFSPAGEVVTVKLSCTDSGARIEVQDKGSGIPPEFQDKIFQKFAQADSSATRAKGGTGLGLSISQAIVERLQGRIGFDSVYGQGATFWVEIPLEPGV